MATQSLAATLINDMLDAVFRSFHHVNYTVAFLKHKLAYYYIVNIFVVIFKSIFHKGKKTRI